MDCSLTEDYVNVLEQTISGNSAAGLAATELDLGQNVRGLAAGQRVFLRYTLIRILGRGGMGVVWLAHDDKLDRQVALKFLPDMLFLDAAARDDLKRETRRSLELTHPNIVRIYDFIEDDSTAAISMEYVDGPTLSQLRIGQNARLFEPFEIEPWLGGLCAALDYAHGAARMVHRDLKPANLMLNARGSMKVTDFGIACSLMGSVARVSFYSSSAGTLVYMSPQQMRGETPSPSDDIYALGATLYELVTGKPPFYTGNISLQACEMEVESMTARRLRLGVDAGVVSESWERTIAACLAKNPSDRPRSAGEIHDRLTSGTNTVSPGYEHTAPTMRLPSLARTQPATTARGISHAPLKHARQTVARIPIRYAAFGVLAAGIVLASLFLGHKSGAGTKLSPVASAAPSTNAAPSAVSASIAEPPALAARGGLIIKTEPPGAMVQLGGEEMEAAPAIFKGITPGKYPVRIILPDYETAELEAEIKSNEFADLGTVTLTRSTGSVELLTSPEGSDFELKPEDGAAQGQGTGLRTGQTPATLHGLPTGTYTLALKHDGWPDEVRTIQVKRGETLPVSWHFASGQLAVTSVPPGANVYLGDHLLGTTPLNVEVAPGAYSDVRVTMDGMLPVTLAATVREGETAQLAAGPLQEMVTALQLTTRPAGLVYVISGSGGTIRQGQTPAAIFDLPAGDYTMSVSRPGWPDFTQAVSLRAKTPVTITHDFPEGTVAITSDPPGASIYQGTTLLGVAPFSMALPPGSAELTAKLDGLPARKHSVAVVDGEETGLAFNMKSGGSSTTAHHHRHSKTPPPSPLAKLGDSIKSFFSGGTPAASSKSSSR